MDVVKYSSKHTSFKGLQLLTLIYKFKYICGIVIGSLKNMDLS